MMTTKLQAKIEKIKQLIRRGAGGESAAAQEALNRIIERHNLDSREVETNQRRFKYSTELEQVLILQINTCLFGDKVELWKDTRGRREIVAEEIEYTDYVAMDCAYEYFRRHMKAQWNEHCLPLIKRKRTPKTKKIARDQLKEPFLTKYFLESKLYLENQLKEIDITTLSREEKAVRMSVKNVEGGKYNEQITTGLYLE